jgi:hypothetical protein
MEKKLAWNAAPHLTSAFQKQIVKQYFLLVSLSAKNENDVSDLLCFS